MLNAREHSTVVAVAVSAEHRIAGHLEPHGAATASALVHHLCSIQSRTEIYMSVYHGEAPLPFSSGVLQEYDHDDFDKAL